MEAKSAPKSGTKTRAPIVVVMGHVDHGKTTLLDYIRKANVAAREAGGITQAVGSYEIEHAPAGHQGAARKITFIDTPGHEAFTAMRSRGATIADLAILVVAADEGVKPQTKEAIQILDETKTPFIVALNKIDRLADGGVGGAVGAGGAGLEKAKVDLMNAGVMLEGYGGQVSAQGISAKTGAGVEELLDLVLLAADLEHLTYDPGAAGSGFVLEARRDPRRGLEATVIIKDGVVKRGDEIVSRNAEGSIVRGKVKILENFLGEAIAELPASSPATVIGLEELPRAGETFTTGKDAESRLAQNTKTAGAGANNKGAAAGAGGASVTGNVNGAGNVGSGKKPQTLNLVLKASDAGSLEALERVLGNIKHPDGKELKMVDSSVGDITDGDVKHALATSATIVGFKNRVEKGAQTLAEAQSVSIITSKIVYDLEKAVQEFLEGSAGPAVTGKLEVLAVFNQDKLDKQLVGGKITAGMFREKATANIIRKNEDVAQTALGTARVLNLREKKSEITQAEEGKEIGVLLSSQHAVQVGDVLVIHK